jgi:alanine dehydrogenase
MSKVNLPKSLIEQILTPKEAMMETPQKKKKVKIGIPKEINFPENRVALNPSAVKSLVRSGHHIIIESEAGLKSGFTDLDYTEAGAEISHSMSEVLKANVILKVAPPSLEEIDLGHAGQIYISPIHLPTMTDEFLLRLKNKRITALAMEYLKDNSGIFPFVRMMSEIAGVGAMQIAADLLSSTSGGKGVLLGGIPGVPPAKVVILGAGVVAEVAARVALGYGVEVRVFDNSLRKLMRLQQNVGKRLYTGTFNTPEMEFEICSADVVIGAIHAESGGTPCIVSEETVENMKTGAVIIDVSIDQGGCFATSKMTTHNQPTFKKYGVIHYCVPNIVSRYPGTGSTAISNILTPFLLSAGTIENIELQIKSSSGLRNGVYMYKGCLTNQFLSEKFSIKYTDIELLMMTDL